MFAQPVDPERDGCPDYLTKVKHPMDLGTILSKLENGEYNTVAEWKADVELVWQNSYIFNGKNSLVTVLARQLQTFFKAMTEYITENEKDDWINKFNDLRSRVTAFRTKAPKKFEPPKALKKEHEQKEDTVVKERTRPARTTSQTAKKPEKKEPKAPIQRSMSARSSSAVPVRTFDQDDVVKLTEDVNCLPEEHMNAIVDLIKTHEPHLVDDSDQEVEIDVNKLKIGTLLALRALVDKLRL